MCRRGLEGSKTFRPPTKHWIPCRGLLIVKHCHLWHSPPVYRGIHKHSPAELHTKQTCISHFARLLSNSRITLGPGNSKQSIKTYIFLEILQPPLPPCTITLIPNTFWQDSLPSFPTFHPFILPVCNCISNNLLWTRNPSLTFPIAC